MDKQLIERIALEVVDEIYHGENQSWRKDGIIAVFADRFLARIDAERGKEAVAWLHESRRESDVVTTAVKYVWGGVAVGSLAAYSIPLFLSPILSKSEVKRIYTQMFGNETTIPEGWPTDDMVVRGAETLHDSLRQSGCDHDFDADLRGTEIQQGIAESVFLSMLAAAQGERNAD